MQGWDAESRGSPARAESGPRPLPRGRPRGWRGGQRRGRPRERPSPRSDGLWTLCRRRAACVTGSAWRARCGQGARLDSQSGRDPAKTHGRPTGSVVGAARGRPAATAAGTSTSARQNGRSSGVFNAGIKFVFRHRQVLRTPWPSSKASRSAWMSSAMETVTVSASSVPVMRESKCFEMRAQRRCLM